MSNNPRKKVLQHTTLESSAKGKHLLILGAIHGDEICGPYAIRKILSEFDSGQLSLLKGQVTFVPVCNPDAYAANKRFSEQNLNRIMYKHGNPQNNEQHFANEVCDFISQADVMLDLHSFESEGSPMIFLDHPTKDMEALANVLDANVVLHGWDNIYEGQPVTSDTTETWARKNNTEGMTFECGQNGTDESNINAYNAILRTLSFYEMIAPKTPQSQHQPKHIEMTKVIIKEREGNFTQTFKDVTELKKGEMIAQYADGEKLSMPYDGFLILPKATTPIWQEWYYIGQRKID